MGRPRNSMASIFHFAATSSVKRILLLLANIYARILFTNDTTFTKYFVKAQRKFCSYKTWSGINFKLKQKFVASDFIGFKIPRSSRSRCFCMVQNIYLVEFRQYVWFRLNHKVKLRDICMCIYLPHPDELIKTYLTPNRPQSQLWCTRP